MRIGVQCDYIGGFSRWGDEKYKKLKEIGFDAVDFNLADTETVFYGEKGEEIILKEKRLAEEAGIEIFQAHGPWRWPPRDFEEADRAERMEKMKRSIYLTKLLGCKNWVVHPIMPFGVEDIGTGNEQKTLEMNMEFLRELTKTAIECDVTICLENMPMHKFSLAKPQDVLGIVNEINDEHFKVCLDTGHVNVFENVLDVAEEVRRVGNEVRVFHIHDNKCQFDLHMLPYFGWTNWEEFAKALSDIKYDGVFSLELTPPEGLPDDIFEQYAKIMYSTAKHIADMVK